MSLDNLTKKKIKQVADDYIKQYLEHKASGMSSKEAIESIKNDFSDYFESNWPNFSLVDQIIKWGSFFFSEPEDQVNLPKPEGKLVLNGLLKIMPLICPESKVILNECEKWLKSYLAKEYSIKG